MGEKMFSVAIKRIIDKNFDSPITLQQLSEEFKASHRTMIVAAKVNNVLKDLQTELDRHAEIEFVDMESEAGVLVYRRSVLFLLITVVKELYPEGRIVAENSFGNGLYCLLQLNHPVNEEDILKIEQRMRKLVAEGRPIIKKIDDKNKVAELFVKSGQMEKVKLVQLLPQKQVSVYYCGDYYDYLYGAKVSNTAWLDKFALKFYRSGLVLMTPNCDAPEVVPEFNDQPKLFNVFQESKEWSQILKCDYVANLNDHYNNNNIGEVIRLSEALHEKKFAQIADQIAANIDCLRVILIAGPSSSGKTTFANRLGIQLKVNGIRPVTISLDDYFIDRSLTPRNRYGEYNFESLYALDIELFNQQLVKLLQGEEVEIPSYNFVTGQREFKGNKVSLEPNQPIVIEGIHGLNEKLTASIPRENKYKIYISALTQLAVDEHNRIPTTGARLIRRIVRDYQFRGSNAAKTLKQWSQVRAGENKNIFPYQEEADVMFNSALIYELGVLKKYALPQLEAVPHNIPEYTLARRLIDFLTYFVDIENETDIPNNSILREFIGGSCFF